MTVKAPQFKIPVAGDKTIQTADDAIAYVEEGLQTQPDGWNVREGGAGWALVRLFGRLADLVIHRLNQVPEKHLLAFLNEAGVDLLPPRPAGTDLTFTPARDGPAFIQVPAGTQVATVQTATRPEVIFETQEDVAVAPNFLVKCIAFDPVNYSDQTAQATGQAASPSPSAARGRSFAAFQGEQERERILYLGDDELYAFPDAASRQAAVVTLCFKFASPGNPGADGWKLEWLYWDSSERKWAGLEAGDTVVTDGTRHFSQDGTVQFVKLPEMTQTEVGGVTGRWIACKLTGGSARSNLPVLRSVTGKRKIEALSGSAAADAVFSALQAGTAFVPLDPAGEFFPLGQHPGRLDTFYLRADEAFSKQGAAVRLDMRLQGVSAPQNESELKKLQVTWEYHCADGWASLGTSKYQVGATAPGFRDDTNAFTASGEKSVEIKVSKPFKKTSVNGQEGYWVRARVLAGSYDEPGKLDGEWLPLKTHAPLVGNFKVSYDDYTEEKPDGPIGRYGSRVDGAWREPGDESGSFSPFRATEEGPALYLGFQHLYLGLLQQAFPAGAWIQLLLDVDEEKEPWAARPVVFWEYWDGNQWGTLRASDGSQGLAERGYLGFFGPGDHQPSVEFGQQAYWLCALPPRLVADAGPDQTAYTTDEEAVVQLDASGSQALRRHGIATYTWRLLSSTRLVADAGPDQTAYTTDEEAVVQLDASGSKNLTGEPIARYTWRKVEAEAQEEVTPSATPYLRAVRLNTVPALNAVTMREETLGSSNGKPGQLFTLLRPPVLPGAQIAVREPDRPPDGELEQLQKELRQADETAQALPPAAQAAPGEGVWVRWHQVSDFHASTPASRHFTLDATIGQVRFGDGKRGKVPPPGRDNIKAVLYRTHDGARGNAKPGTVTVLRNPSGDLAYIKGATNPEAAAGGSSAETVEEVEQRGPQSLKHRGRAVTIEDFAWLAREASGEVVEAHCLPACNPLGLPEPGWVTVVITPESTDARPTPSPALVQQVQAYVEDHALANLKTANQIHVRGPEYIEVTVLARVVPLEPARSGEVERAVLERLTTFLHPLLGGPERRGWGLGRNVYLSEVYAEIEAVPGVDHVAGLRLLGSLQQVRLRLGAEQKTGQAEQNYRKVPFDLPAGSQVSTFDERTRLLLAEPLPERKSEAGARELSSLAVRGFKVGDQAAIVRKDNRVIRDNLTIAALSYDALTFDWAVTFDWPFALPAGAGEPDALLSPDGRLRLPLAEGGIAGGGDGKVTRVTVRGFQPGDKVSVVVGTRRDPVLEFLPVEKVEPCEERIFVPQGHLICAGDHDIEMILE